MSRGTIRIARFLAAFAALADAAAVHADAWGLQLNPVWTSAGYTIRDETGHVTTGESSALTQRYRLSLSEVPWSRVQFSAGGNLDWTLGTSRAGDERVEIDSKTWNGTASLRVGSPELNGALDYNRREQASDVTSGGVAASGPVFVRQSYGASVSWRPSELPSVDLQLTHSDTFDRQRVITDLTGDGAAFTLRYEPVRRLDLRYALTVSKNVDRLKEFESRAVANSLNAGWGDSFLDGRVSVYGNYVGSVQSTLVTARRPGGEILTQQIPAGGLSKVEVFPDAPARVTLNPNAALVNGDAGTSAGLNLGYSATARSDIAYRDLGAAFPNVVTPVNTVYVYVDRPIPTSLAATFSWTAWRSDDNLDWTPVAIPGPIAFDPLQNRFEIPIDKTATRYLKVVTRPLGVGLTTDPQWSEIFVTEVQFFLAVPVADAVGRSFAFSESWNATARALLVRRWNLSYDLSAGLSHSVSRGKSSPVTWSVTNGLTIANRLSPVWSYAARVDRADSDAGAGHAAQTRLSAGVTAEPLPTLGGSVTYSAAISQSSAGTSTSNGVAASAHADLYEGISAGAGAGYSVAENEKKRISQSTNATASLSLVPNRKLSMNGSIAWAYSDLSGGGLPPATNRSGIVDGTLSYSPFPALALAGGVTRVFLGRPSTLANFSVSVSPFREGDLQIQYSYHETIDTGADSRSRSHGPGARWNIRRGWYLTSGAQFSTTTDPAQRTDSWSYSASLLVTL